MYIEKYIETRKDNNEALFVSLIKPYNRLGISGVEILIRNLGREANINKLHPHKFRRTMATMAIDKGMPIEQVQKLLGHIKIDTTMEYAMVSQSKELTGIDYKIRYQYEFNEQPETQEVFKTILKNREYVAKKLDQKYGNLRVRMSCPICGLTDKNSVNNVYTEDTITFYCPEHGEYSINVNEGISKLEYNSPLRNLIRGMSYTATNQSEDYDFEILRITGSDYAGFYQEELRYKVASYLGCKVSDMSMIFYAPLVLDWSGAKLSKSLYVKKGAYGDIPKRFINYSFLKEDLGFKSIVSTLT